LRGTALEYLEGASPEIQNVSGHSLDDQRSRAREPAARGHLADVRSHLSIMLNLEELQQRARRPEEENRLIPRAEYICHYCKSLPKTAKLMSLLDGDE
jgi:hypothetical protein